MGQARALAGLEPLRRHDELGGLRGPHLPARGRLGAARAARAAPPHARAPADHDRRRRAHRARRDPRVPRGRGRLAPRRRGAGGQRGRPPRRLRAGRHPARAPGRHRGARGRGGLDVLVWPENAAEWFADEDPGTSAVLEQVADAFGAPLITGTVTREGDGPEYDRDADDTYNSLLLVAPGEGAVAEYRKRHPVPFAEYLPARPFFAPILDALGFLDLIPRDYSIDPTSANAFDLADGGGPDVVAGLAICFDIIDDRLAREMVLDHGARIILAPTNNADFGEGSAENVQQLAIARLRAVEAGRALVNVSTVGTSAMVLPDGSFVERLPQYEPGTMLADLPLSATVTPGIRVGGWIEWALCIGGVLGLAAAGALRMRTRRSGDA
ncbi:apolipoprotein N-acyltransferase [Agrococcus sp. SL85]|uniref:apolipoprotein N-acyltransferase n=1 Tax=Agrococcus sp. SL85 TaxID=2995141 RepID=UPI00226CEC61|nr:apolipoprotein N-acyltransferase [Agrococcus sp. SL85]WAC65945.1 apolipoprotein N-acyltransferase [Agrococcus sp. SL85]